jgi:hypothetical protein
MSLTGGTLNYSYESFLQRSLNLGDLPSAATARGNLGINLSTSGTANAVVQYDATGNLTTQTTISGNALGLGTTTPSCSLSFGTPSVNKVLALYDNAPSDAPSTAVNFLGFGATSSALRYNVPHLGTHNFYAASNLLATIQSSGLVTNSGATFGGARSASGAVSLVLQTNSGTLTDYAQLQRNSGTAGALSLVNTGTGSMSITSGGSLLLTSGGALSASCTSTSITSTSDITLTSQAGSLVLDATGLTLMNGGGQVPYGKVLTVYGREKVYYDNTYASQGGALVIGDVDGFSAASTSPVLLALTQSGLSTSNNVSIQMGKASSNTALIAYNFNSNTANTTFSINHFGSTNQLVLRSNGNMGLGTALPGSALSFGTNSGNKILTLYDNSPTDTASTAVNFFGFGINSSTLRYNVPYNSVHSFYGGSNVIATLSSTSLLGTGTVYTNAGIFTSTNPSDRRLKSNIAGITTERALEVISNLNPVSFNWSDADRFGSGTKYGFIAQDVQAVVPEIVRQDGDTLGYDPVSLIPFLVEAVKELLRR